MFELKILFITGIIALLILLLVWSRVWVLFEYEEAGIHVWAGFGPFYFSMYPFNPKWNKRKGVSRKQRKFKHKQERSLDDIPEKKGISVGLFRELLDLSLKVLGKFRRKLRIDELRIYLNWGAEDPADAAISYGYAHAVMNGLLALLEVNFQVKDQFSRINLDYTLDKPNIYLKASCSLKIYEAISLGLTVGVKAFDIYRKRKQKKVKIKKAV